MIHHTAQQISETRLDQAMRSLEVSELNRGRQSDFCSLTSQDAMKNTMKNITLRSALPLLLIVLPTLAHAQESASETPSVESELEPMQSESSAPKEDKSTSSAPKDDRSLEQELQGSEIAPERKSGLVFEDFQRQAQGFVEHASEYRAAQGKLFDFTYKLQSERIETLHKDNLDNAGESERSSRKESIKRFKSFINSTAAHPQYTPDSLYRLGMLLLEEASDQYAERLAEYNRKVDEAEDQVEMAYPQRDEREVIMTFDRLIRDWPDYRDLDAALYARGYSHYEMGSEQKALRDFQTIVKRYPKSSYRTEVWYMLGELHFQFAELPEAIKAYSEVIKDTQSLYYAPAFYKLAWTYYRNDEFEEAVESFKKLISYSDQEVAAGRSGFELRDEALQYLAISLNEDDWDDDGVTDPGAGFKRVQRYLKSDESYQAELLDKLVGIFYDNTKYEEAILTAQHLFKLHPHYRRNPEIHSKIITAYERIAQPEKAFSERDKITNSYVIDGPWYVSNHRDQDAIDLARTLMKDSLLQAGTYHHERAQAFRERASESEGDDSASLMANAKSSYTKAALSYQRYLQRYRRDENTYELLYLYADALFYSQDYERAFKQYLIVRDSKMGNDHLEEAAFSAILSHVEIVKTAISRGELEGKPSLLEEARVSKEPKEENDSNSSEMSRVTAQEIPTLAQEAIQLREEYINLGLKVEEDPHRVAVMVYKVGDIYMDYLNYPEARKRFIEVIEKHGKAPVAINAANSLIESYRLERDWIAMAEWAEKIAQAGLGDEMVAQAKIWKVGALFKTAKALFDQEKFKESATEYITLVDQNPDNEFAAAALNNGAVAFEKARMFDSAMKTYERIFNQFPNSEFSENALFRVAYNAERFYDYERAVRTFGQLAKRYPKGENAADASYNAARLLEQTQDYNAAAQAYQDYARRFPDKENTPAIFFETSKCYEKLGDWSKQLKLYEAFIKKYGNDPKQNDRVITALAKTVEIYEKRGNSRQINLARQKLIDAFDARGIPPGGYVARFPAKAAFMLIEPRFEAFKKMKIKGNMRQQGQIISKIKSEIVGLTEDYSRLLKYKSLDWNIASFYRIGVLRQLFAQALYELPIPKGLSIEEEDIYTTQIEEIAIPIEDEAVQRFETAFKKAREFRVSNEWTKQILIALNKYKPAEYPTFKDEKRLETPNSRSNSGFILPEGAKPKETNQKEDQANDGSEPRAPSSEDRTGDRGRREPKLPNDQEAKDGSSSEVESLEGGIDQAQVEQPSSKTQKSDEIIDADSSDVEAIEVEQTGQELEEIE